MKKTTRKWFKKRLAKGIKIFQKKKKTKSVNMLVKDIKIVLKNKKKKASILLEHHQNLPEDKKRMIAEHRRNNFIIHRK